MDLKKTHTAQTTVEHKQSVRTVLAYALAQGDSLALWRLPNSVTEHLIVSKSVRKFSSIEGLEQLEPGFLISPFLPQAVKTFLPADYYFRFEGGALCSPASAAETNSHTWLREQSTAVSENPVFYEGQNINEGDTDRLHFINLVEEAILCIRDGAAEKIVPSRHKKLQHSVDPAEAFEKLCQRYPTAMVSLISTPEHGTWLGATPEILVSIENNTLFKTVALAGTKAWQVGTDLREVAWTQKEIEEQALVERYIISCFKKIRLREYEEHGPKTIVAGNLMHLMSDFRVDMKAVNFPQLGSVMLQLLHPTSAVCGMPMEPALQFLLDREGYDRSLYSGYLGPVNIEQNTHLFVNIRCMQWCEKSVTLYAGAGVTVDSIPEREWEETEMKMDTILKAIE